MQTSITRPFAEPRPLAAWVVEAANCSKDSCNLGAWDGQNRVGGGARGQGQQSKGTASAVSTVATLAERPQISFISDSPQRPFKYLSNSRQVDKRCVPTPKICEVDVRRCCLSREYKDLALQ